MPVAPSRTLRWLAAGVGLAAGGYAALVATAWHRYGRPASPAPDEADPLLDRFMPELLIRWMLLPAVKAEAERRASEQGPAQT